MRVSFSKLAAAIWPPVTLLAALSAAPAQAETRVGVAMDFLNKVESGNRDAAFAMLTNKARQGHSPSDLQAPQKTPGANRRVSFEGAVDAGEVNQPGSGQYQLVCMIDVPPGSGQVTAISVTLVESSGQFEVADYRYDSHPSRACASRT